MRLIDLSGELYDGQGGHLEIAIQDHRTHEETRDWFAPPAVGMAAKKLTLCDHSGTHVDAPLHFIPDGRTIDQVPLESFAGPGWVADFSRADGTGEQLTLDDFERWCDEADDRNVEAGDAVLFRLKKPDGDNAYVGLSEDLSRHLVDAGARLVGTDQGSIDWPKNKSRPAHRLLLAAGIPIVEGLINLDQLADESFTFLALPLKLRGATGSPVRAAAWIE